MRTKELKLIITFFTTTAAMEMEKMCALKSISGRLIPVPRNITSNCGMSWCTNINERNKVENMIKECGIQVEGWYEALV